MRTNKRNYIYVFGFLGIVLLIFNVFVFAINQRFEANFWSGYLFTTISYVLVCMVCIIPIGIRKSKNNGIFYSYPLMIFSALYMILQLFVGCCVIFINNFNLRVSLVLQVLLLMVYLLFVVIVMFYRNNTEQILYGTKAKRFFKNEVEMKINSLTSIAEGQYKTSLEKIKEQVKYEVENLSTEQASNVENKIIVKIDELEESVATENEEKVAQLCKEISYLLRQRNELCKNRM